MPNNAVRAAAEGMPKAIFNTVAEFPPKYGMLFSGDEFAPKINDGDALIFSSTAKPARDDFVIAWLRPDKMQAGIYELFTGHPDLTLPFDKAPQSTAEPVFTFRAGKGRVRPVKASLLLAVHKCVGVQTSIGQEG